jgi:hypothetical protein
MPPCSDIVRLSTINRFFTKFATILSAQFEYGALQACKNGKRNGLMKKILLTTLLAVTAISANAGDVGVSINIGEPNFYGSIDIGNYPRPQLIAPQPVIIQPQVGIAVAPIYLHVPVEHYSNWRRYCGVYNACGRPVYFVHDNWYRQVYAPRYREEHRDRHEERRDEHWEEHRDHDHEHDRDHDHERDHDHDHGHHDDDRR